MLQKKAISEVRIASVMEVKSVKHENVNYVICSAYRVQVDVRDHSIVDSIERE